MGFRGFAVTEATKTSWNTVAKGTIGGGDAALMISDDPLLASYHLATLAPIGPADRLRLLSAEGPGARLDLLDEILDDVEAMLKFRLST